MKITIIVITENEESNITPCLESAKWADEIIIVDSHSKDRTIELANNFTDKIFDTDIINVTAKREFSIQKSSNDWIFFLDADERITDDLKNELLSLEHTENIAAYYINRDNYYLGRKIKHCSMSPDLSLRLFNRNKSELNNRIVHESIITKGETKTLSSSMIHLTVPNLSILLKKMNYYSSMESAEHFQNGKRITKIGAITHAVSAFVRMYISRKGFMEGLPGFYLSIAESFTNFFTHLKLLKLQNKL